MESSMLYYVRSGDLDKSTQARSHKQAAIKVLSKNELELGVCVIVSKSEEIDENALCFLTDNILAECGTFRVVD
jgi:hypothetical protein